MKRIAVILGTRPEAIKLLPVYLALRSRTELDPILISTGQHREMVHDVVRLFGCRLDHDLDVMEPNQSLPHLSSKLFSRLDTVIDNTVTLAVVQGDTTTAMIGAMLAFYKGVPSAHIEAGLRSGDLQSPFPEEYNRRIITLSASLHFAPTEMAANNLRRERANGSVHVVGNTSIDAAFEIARSCPGPSTNLMLSVPALQDPKRRVILVTAHRRENIGTPLRNILTAVKEIAAEDAEHCVIWPVHPNPNVASMVREFAGRTSNIYLTEPLSYSDLIYLIKRSRLIMTDSGGIQEEAPAFNKPVIVLRNTTERPEGVEAGCSVVAGTSVNNIVRHFRRIHLDAETYRRMSQAKNPYGDGTASRRIADVIAGME